MTATTDPRDSIWGRWDPHILAPGTALDNQFGGLTPGSHIQVRSSSRSRGLRLWALPTATAVTIMRQSSATTPRDVFAMLADLPKCGARRHVAGASVELSGADGAITAAELPVGNHPDAAPGVPYSQQLVERLCSAEGITETMEASTQRKHTKDSDSSQGEEASEEKEAERTN